MKTPSRQLSENDLLVFSGTANPELAREISEFIELPLGGASIRSFSDGEIFIEINQNVRGKDVFVIQPTAAPVNINLMELLIMVDALKRASAKRITAVLPYYGYARQDSKTAPRVPISAKLVADLITVAGINRVITMDLHRGQIQGFFNIPVDHLLAAPVQMAHLKKAFNEEVVIVSPDAGGVERARDFAERMASDLAIIDKREDEPEKARHLDVIGDVKGKTAVIFDDIVDTGNTIIKAAESLIDHGARRVYACVTHPVLSNSSVDMIERSPIEKLAVTNSIKLSEKALGSKKIVRLSVARLFAEAILRVHRNDSVSSLFV